MPEGGHIVFIGSVLARFGAAGSIAYTASKHALLGVTRALAAELAPRRIKVNCVNPGFVDTKMAQDVLRRLAAERGVSLQEITNEMLGGQPFARMVRPAEVAAYVDFLLGPGGEAITGQGVDISCGSVMV
jgi:NAD(P)-dependent dehydrogenase (short-subunit alcohol dehydrogenase family)